jgi:hypothetical protein
MLVKSGLNKPPMAFPDLAFAQQQPVPQHIPKSAVANLFNQIGLVLAQYLFNQMGMIEHVDRKRSPSKEHRIPIVARASLGKSQRIPIESKHIPQQRQAGRTACFGCRMGLD